MRIVERSQASVETQLIEWDVVIAHSKTLDPFAVEITLEHETLTHRKGRTVTSWTIAEFSCPMDGRAFVLRGEAGEMNDVFVCRNGQDNLCTCSTFENFGVCRHLESVTAVMEQGGLDRPEAGRALEYHPSPEQLAAEAGVEDPFKGVCL